MIVKRYVDYFRNSPTGERVAMALLDLKRAESFAGSLGEIAETLTRLISTGHETRFDRLSAIQDVFFINPAGDVRPVLDLRTLASDLRGLSDDLVRPATRTEGFRVADTFTADLKRLRDQADKLANAINRPAANGRDSVSRAVDPESAAEASTALVVHHDEHPDLRDLHGVGVFAPFVVDKEFRKQLEIDNPKEKERDDVKGRRDYEGLKIFAARTGASWPKLVYETLRLEEPDEIVDATGVVLPAERLQVNQLLAAVESAFNRLDCLLKNAEPQLVAAVSQTKKDDLHSKAILATFGPPRLKLAADLSLEDPE